MPNSVTSADSAAEIDMSAPGVLSPSWLRECRAVGFLEKRGHHRHTFRNWRRRFFALRGVEVSSR